MLGSVAVLLLLLVTLVLLVLLQGKIHRADVTRFSKDPHGHSKEGAFLLNL